MRPFHHQKLCDGTHAQKGRWFPLEYVLPILDHLEKERSAAQQHRLARSRRCST